MPQVLDETIALQEGTVLGKQHLAVDVEDFPVEDLDDPNTESEDDEDVFLEEEDEEEDDGDVFLEEDDNGDEEGDDDDGDGDIYRDREMDQCAYELRRACWESARLTQTVLRLVPRPSLSQLEFIIEVGDCETELLRRAALHARACFAVRPYRSSFVSIIFNSHSFDVRVLLFHRSGVVSSPLMELFTPGGFRDFVRHSSGLFSRGMAGMSFSRSRRFIFVQAHVADLGGGPPKFTVLYVRQVIIQQLCLRGRATLVEKLGLLCYADSQDEAIHKTFLRLHDMPPSDLVDLPDVHEK